MPTIDILLATYNGERFLPELLGSLAEQTHTDWRLVVRDDGSSDDTLAIVEEWASRAEVPVRILDDGRKGLGASGNFGALLEYSDAPYFAFCDQDDVWLPEKLRLMLARVQAAEERRGAKTPLLVHSDLRVVDTELSEIHSSFWEFAGLQAPRPGRQVQDLMMQNVVTGCASMGNAALGRAAIPIPPEAIMHDWWLALVAAAMGELLDTPQATILYRQHGTNTLGAVEWSVGSMIVNLLTDPLASVRRARASMRHTQRQAQKFHARYKCKLGDADADVMRRYGELEARSAWERKRFVFEKRLWSTSYVRNAALLAFI